MSGEASSGSYPGKPGGEQRRRLVAVIILGSLAVHGAVAVIAGLWIVVRHFVKAPSQPAEPPPVVMRAPPPEPDRDILPGTGGQGMASPISQGRIQSLAASLLPLPELPRFQVSAAASSPWTAMLASSSLAALDQVQFPGGGDSDAFGVAGNADGTGLTFLGVQTHAKRVVLMYDVSRTVANAAARAGIPMERIREETLRLMEGLGVNTRFALVQFARNYAFFRRELSPSTSANRQAASQWLTRHFVTTGVFPRSVPGMVGGSPGFLVVLEEVFCLRPDAVFIISDGSFQRGASGDITISLSEIQSRLSVLQAELPQPANIFFLGVGVSPAHEQGLRKMLAAAGGRGGYSQLHP